MKINHNIAAMNTLHHLNRTSDLASKSMERLSSGLRINSASDDAAGMAISTKMDAQIRGLQQANRNAMDGISMIQTAEGATNEMHAILQRMRELSVQAANGTYSDEDREKVQTEINQLTEEINRISQTTEFNTKTLLQGADDNTGLLDNDQPIDPTTGVTWTIPNPMTEEEIQELAGKSVSIEPDIAQITFGTDIDLTGVTDSAQLAQKVADAFTATGLVTTTVTGDAIEIIPNAGVGAGEDMVLSDGPLAGEANFVLQIGANESQTLEVKLGELSTDALGLTAEKGTPGYSADYNVSDGKETDKTKAAVSVLTQEDAGNAISVIDNAISIVSQERAVLGAVQNRLEHTSTNLDVSEQNLTEAMSRIQDADMAYEMSQYTQQNVLTQAATSMLAQANQRPQQVLQLLQG